jgi:hypothetical protein
MHASLEKHRKLEYKNYMNGIKLRQGGGKWKN